MLELSANAVDPFMAMSGLNLVRDNELCILDRIVHGILPPLIVLWILGRSQPRKLVHFPQLSDPIPFAFPLLDYLAVLIVVIPRAILHAITHLDQSYRHCHKQNDHCGEHLNGRESLLEDDSIAHEGIDDVDVPYETDKARAV